MMTKRLLLIFSCFILLTGRVVRAEQTSEDIAVSKVPLKVMNAAKGEFFAIKFTEAARVTDDEGQEFYELEGVKDGIAYVVQVSADGKVLNSGQESAFEEERLERKLSDLPAKVRTAAEGAKGGLVLTGYRTEKEYGRLTYEVEGLHEGQCYEVEITAEGEVLESEECD